MIRNTLFTIAALCCGSLLATTAKAQTSELPVQVVMPQIDLSNINELNVISNEDYALIVGDDNRNLGAMAHSLGKDDEVTCGFCGTNDDDEELPFDPGKTDWNGHIEVFPNPTTDHFFIRGGAYMVSIQLLAMDGRLVRTIEPTADAISTENLTAGVYLLQMDNGARVVTKKLVVQ